MLKMWLRNCIFFLIAVLQCILIPRMVVDGAIRWQDRNDILDGDLGDLRCSKLIADVKWTEATMSARLPPDLSGTWLSQRCEVRPGPEYLLRKYKFSGNNSFELQQFYYADHQCFTPTYGVLAEGYLHMTSPSWTVPGGMDSDYFLNRVQVMAYSADIADVLMARANHTCPGYVTKTWHANHWYTIYRYVEMFNGSKENEVQVLEDLDCMESFQLVFHELQLLRTEYRKQRRQKQKRGKGRRAELLLGDVHPDPEKRFNYRPTGYQVPLMKSDQVKTVTIARLVYKSSPLFPPHLDSQVTSVPLQLQGEWISTRCETRPFSMFLTRRLFFYDGGQNTWQGMYNYFLDPRCRKPIFSLIMRGHYYIGNASDLVEGANDVDFTIDTLELTAHTISMVSNLNGHMRDSCGKRGSWRLGVSQDLAKTGGCSGLGLKVPSQEMEISKMEMDRYGNSWLYIGQPNGQDNSANPKGPRPTSYQLPLLQCRMHIRDEEEENTLYQFPGSAIVSARLRADKNASDMLKFGRTGVLVVIIGLVFGRYM